MSKKLFVLLLLVVPFFVGATATSETSTSLQTLIKALISYTSQPTSKCPGGATGTKCLPSTSEPTTFTTYEKCPAGYAVSVNKTGDAKCVKIEDPVGPTSTTGEKPAISAGGTTQIVPINGKCPSPKYLVNDDGTKCLKIATIENLPTSTTGEKPAIFGGGTTQIVPVNGRCPSPKYVINEDGTKCLKVVTVADLPIAPTVGVKEGSYGGTTEVAPISGKCPSPKYIVSDDGLKCLKIATMEDLPTIVNAGTAQVSRDNLGCPEKYVLSADRTKCLKIRKPVPSAVPVTVGKKCLDGFAPSVNKMGVAECVKVVAPVPEVSSEATVLQKIINFFKF